MVVTVAMATVMMVAEAMATHMMEATMATATVVAGLADRRSGTVRHASRGLVLHVAVWIVCGCVCAAVYGA